MALSRFTLATKMALLSFASVFLAVVIGGAVAVQRFSTMMEKEMGMRTMAIARTLAQMETIQENVGRPGGEKIIQPIAEKTRLSTGVEYIVVLDMEGIRYSHPVEDRIGEKFSGEDLAPALANNEYISRAEGVLGPSIRAFTPIKVDEGTRQVGVVVVGVLTPTLSALLHSMRMEIYLTLGLGIMVGLLGSLFLARKVKQAMFSLEPEEIARLLKERVAIFEAMGEGIIAIDTSARITVMNDEARRIFGVDESVIGQPVNEVIGGRLLRVLQTGEPEMNRERVINGITILTNRVPIRMDDKIIGAVATFRDKTEVKRLAEELTGVKAFVEALRVQNHENMNKLHTIAGLIQLERYQDALDYIFKITEEQEELTRFLTRNICDYSLAGLLLGKYGRAKELRVELVIDRKSNLKELPSGLEVNSLVVIIGNLLENALDAVCQVENEKKQVFFFIQGDRNGIFLEVRDTGPGIPPEIRERIFDEGFTTKGSRYRGLGLFLVKRNVKNMAGRLEVDCPPGGGTIFTVSIPAGYKKAVNQ